jgi:hypothetical protein
LNISSPVLEVPPVAWGLSARPVASQRVQLHQSRVRQEMPSFSHMCKLRFAAWLPKSPPGPVRGLAWTLPSKWPLTTRQYPRLPLCSAVQLAVLAHTRHGKA